jgi:hypothetical protein
MKFALSFLTALLAMVSVSRASPEANVITASVSPDICDTSAITSATPQTITITYTIKNQSAQAQAWCRYCTIHLEIEEGERSVPLRNVGRDATRKIASSDIVILKPGETASLKVQVAFIMMPDGSLVMTRTTEDGSVWQSGSLSHPGQIQVKGAYALSFAKNQSGFDSVPQDAKAFANKLANAPFLMVGETPLPAVKITLKK